VNSPVVHNLVRNSVIIGDVRTKLADLPVASVDTVITSPPYFQLRDYGSKGQIGLEDDVSLWVDELRLVMGGLGRVLKPSGSVWLNLGDSYSRGLRFGAPAKSLLLGPERLAIGLIDDGWTIRNKVIWSKSRTMPTSVRDRLACKWEVIYLLTRSRQYHFDLDAIRVPHTSAVAPGRRRPGPYPPAHSRPPVWAGPLAGSNSGLAHMKREGRAGHPLGKNPGDVVRLPSANFRGQHFATFPPDLVEQPLLATCPERVCSRCGEPWQRGPGRALGQLAVRGDLRPACKCHARWQPGLVLDPFFGAGTVGLVAEQHKRDWLGIELNPDFATLATRRIDAARSQIPSTTIHHRAA
jgi:DNA modification methylase